MPVRKAGKPLRSNHPYILAGGDCWCKFCASQLNNCLPYARKEEDSKAKVVYNRMSRQELISAFICVLLPFVLLLPVKMWPATLFPLLAFVLLCRLMKRRLQGYKGNSEADCASVTAAENHFIDNIYNFVDSTHILIL